MIAAERWYQERMPRVVRIGGGLDGGMYDDISAEIGRRIAEHHAIQVDTVSTDGSLDNRQRLLSTRW